MRIARDAPCLHDALKRRGPAIDSLGEVEARTWAALRPAVATLGTRRSMTPSGLERRLAWLYRTLCLPAPDGAILKLAVRVALFRAVHSSACAASGSHAARDEINVAGLSALLADPIESVRQRLKPSRPLRLLGLIEDQNGGDFAPSRTVMHIARLSASGDEALYASRSRWGGLRAPR